MKPINPGELNRRIQICRLYRKQTAEGYEVTQEELILGCWAKVTRNSGTELVKANGDFEKETVRFLIRRPVKVIDRTMIVRFEGKDYEIEYVNPYNGRQYVEIWAKRLRMDMAQTVTLYIPGEDAASPAMTVLRGVFVDRTRASGVNTNGLVNQDSVTLYIPLDVEAENAETGDPQHYLKPKAYSAKEDKAPYWTIDPGAGQIGCFFALGELSECAKYQTINQKYDDVYRVQSAALRNFGTSAATYLEVGGR